ncbi:MAG: hypothetical protein NWR76_05145 [Opitutales bacterium]|jgi:hypothetical protein|nr:hypothetical protein [Opitutales bacterium]
MKLIFNLILIISICSCALEGRIFTNQDGREIDAELKSIGDKTVRLVLETDNRTYEVPIESLLKPDQSYIAIERKILALKAPLSEHIKATITLEEETHKHSNGKEKVLKFNAMSTYPDPDQTLVLIIETTTKYNIADKERIRFTVYNYDADGNQTRGEYAKPKDFTHDSARRIKLKYAEPDEDKISIHSSESPGLRTLMKYNTLNQMVRSIKFENSAVNVKGMTIVLKASKSFDTKVAELGSIELTASDLRGSPEERWTFPIE